MVIFFVRFDTILSISRSIFRRSLLFFASTAVNERAGDNAVAIALLEHPCRNLRPLVIDDGGKPLSFNLVRHIAANRIPCEQIQCRYFPVFRTISPGARLPRVSRPLFDCPDSTRRWEPESRGPQPVLSLTFFQSSVRRLSFRSFSIFYGVSPTREHPTLRRRMSFQVQHALCCPMRYGWLTMSNWRFHRSVIEEQLHVFRIEPQAAIGCCQSACWPVYWFHGSNNPICSSRARILPGIFRPGGTDFGEDIPFFRWSSAIEAGTCQVGRAALRATCIWPVGVGRSSWPIPIG